MATINHGVMGGFSGAVGTVVGGNWNGIDYMRARASDKKDAKSPAQLDQRARFRAVMQFLKPFKAFLPVGFKNHKVGVSPYNAASSLNLQHALKGVSPDYSIDYSKVRISQGSLPGALNPVIVSGQDGQIAFRWENNSAKINAMANDKAVLVVYNPQKEQAVTFLSNNSRLSGSGVFALPASFAGDEVHCYIAFQNASQTIISDSQYAGSISI